MRARQSLAAAPLRPRDALLAAVLLCCDTALADCGAEDHLTRFVRDAYGAAIEFDVLRNGKPVGEHVTRFERRTDGLAVRSRMSLGVSVLFIPVYRFEYRSDALWCAGTLTRLNAVVEDGGDRTEVEAVAGDGEIDIRRGDVSVSAPAGLIPTNHWNAAAIEQDALLNTITGRVNAISVSGCDAPSPLVAASAPRDAQCYQYSGDLDARVWYAPDGRWVGLEFAGRDGSSIVYTCRRCGTTP